jgi:hypothetical protein
MLIFSPRRDGGIREPETQEYSIYRFRFAFRAFQGLDARHPGPGNGRPVPEAAPLGLNPDLRKPPVLTEKEAAGFSGPAHMRAAGNDVCFPAPDGFPRIESRVVEWPVSVLRGGGADAKLR